MIYNKILRTNIMNFIKENKYIVYKNLDFSNKEMKRVLNDQFRKLRNHFS